MNAEVLRELGCEHRTFRTVKGALLWYVDQMLTKLRMNHALGEERVRLSVEERERGRATLAKVRNCCEEAHESDAEITGMRLREMLPLRGELLMYLIAWYEADYGDGARLARKAAMTRWAFDRRCQRTEKILRHRMQAAGLLVED